MAMDGHQDDGRPLDCCKLNDLAQVCFHFLIILLGKEATMALLNRPSLVPRLHPSCKKRRSALPPLPPHLPPPAGPAPSDFHLASSSDCDLTIHLGPPNKKLKLTGSFSGGGAYTSFASSSAMTCPAERPVKSWMTEHAQIEGTEPVLLGEKLLRESDAKGGQSRLLMPGSLAEGVYQQTRDWEMERINSNGLEVLVLDLKGRQHQMVCKFRASQQAMVFTGGWNGFVKANGLQEGHRLGIFAFRSHASLCFLFLRMDQD